MQNVVVQRRQLAVSGFHGDCRPHAMGLNLQGICGLVLFCVMLIDEPCAWLTLSRGPAPMLLHTPCIDRHAISGTYVCLRAS